MPMNVGAGALLVMILSGVGCPLAMLGTAIGVRRVLLGSRKKNTG